MNCCRGGYFEEDKGNFIYWFNEEGSGKKLYSNMENSVDRVEKVGVDYVFLVGDVGMNGMRGGWSRVGVGENREGIEGMIDGESCSGWGREYGCDGLMGVNDKGGKWDVLKGGYKGGSGKKRFVWSIEDLKKKGEKVLDRDRGYLLIRKEGIDMRKMLVEEGFKCGIRKVMVGGCNEGEG